MDTAWALQNRLSPTETSVVRTARFSALTDERVRHFDPNGDRQPALAPVSTSTIALLEMRKGDVERFEKPRL